MDIDVSDPEGFVKYVQPDFAVAVFVKVRVVVNLHPPHAVEAVAPSISELARIAWLRFQNQSTTKEYGSNSYPVATGFSFQAELV
jgi:hypothetical protein